MRKGEINGMKFKLKTKLKPKGDQPQAIEKLIKGLEQGRMHQTLLGVTGSGKTFTVANVINAVQKPTLVIAPNKTLAAQLTQEYRSFFPNNAVEYFVSYYDYYQPEAYLPATDTYIEKESDINKEIERLRLAATAALMTRQDVIIVASVSCIYGLGSPQTYQAAGLMLGKCSDTLQCVSATRERWNRKELMEKLIDIHFTRSEVLERGRFRWHGSILEVMPAERNVIYRLEFSSGDKIEKILEFDSVTRAQRAELDKIYISPARHFVVIEPMMNEALKSIEKELGGRLEELKTRNELLAAERLERRTKYDIAMMREIGYCAGIENYSRHLTGRAPGEPPYTLIDYFPPDFLMIIDESHVTIPQLNGMFGGDYSRKKNLVDNGFRLPSAFDNRPLKFPEFEAKVNRVIYTSATPGDYERRHSFFDRDALQCVSTNETSGIVEQIIRPTGLIDPEIIIKPIKGQVGDLIERIKERAEKNERILVTTLTKKMAEDLSEYLKEKKILAEYLHSEVNTIERVKILEGLRKGKFSVLVGVNLLREGLDLPEVSLVAILDADKEGFLRSETSLIQTIGRAARNIHGQVIFYADVITGSMKHALRETERRRKIQIEYNKKHHITPATIKKEIKSIIDYELNPKVAPEFVGLENLELKDVPDLIKIKEDQMRHLAENLEFEKAALVRDEISQLRKIKI